jgi:hypothetical protein
MDLEVPQASFTVILPRRSSRAFISRRRMIDGLLGVAFRRIATDVIDDLFPLDAAAIGLKFAPAVYPNLWAIGAFRTFD